MAKDGVDIPNVTDFFYNATQSEDYRLKINENGIVSFSNIISVIMSNNPSFQITNVYSSNISICSAYGYYYLPNSPSGTNTYGWYKITL